ncbi:MAG: acyl-CoA dehydrogenase family protein [Pseudomonadales bacterium]|nr:acyl-CoA dehydrogenase family protein [Pseudomonadales bacterium]
MDFSFTSEQIIFQETIRRFGADKLAPLYQQREVNGTIDKAICMEMGALGMIGPELPEKFGGMGLSSVTAGIAIEEVARADFNVSYIQLIGSLMGTLIAQHAAEEIAQRVVSGICAGTTIVALGLTEPGGGSDAAHLSLRATKSGSGYILNGEKTSISLADQASEIVVFGRTGDSDGAGGISAFLVPMDAEGVSTTRFDDLGSNAVGRGSVFFDDVFVSADAMIGPENQGFRVVMRGFDYSRALIGLQCIACAEASISEAWEYVKEREAFGGPIARFQGVTEPLAEAETLLYAAKLLCYKTLWLRDKGEPHTSEAAMCKWWAPRVAFDAIHNALLVHGHYGYSRELPHQQRLRDVLGLQIGDGTQQIQKMIIAREKIGRVAVPY